MDAETKAERRRPTPARRRTRRGPNGGSDCRDAATATLEEAVLASWEDLAVGGIAGCPVCRRGRLESAGCADCGSLLS